MKNIQRGKAIKLSFPILVAMVLVLVIIGTGAASSIPVISIVSVDEGKTVTVSGVNFPIGQSFTVRMGAYGSYALNGTEVGVQVTAADTFTATYNIPAEMADATRIAIRLDSPEGYYSYNWFWNATSPVVPVVEPTVEPTTAPEPPAYTGYPTFGITDVERNVAVGIETVNLPAGQTFTVLMGKYGTKGVSGIEAGSLSSEEGGAVKATFNIPAELADLNRIAIRLESAEGYFAYNWFWNNSTGAAAAGSVEETPTYSGIPTIAVDAVARDASVTISGKNFPAAESFKVLMGKYGTKGIGGIEIGTYDSGAGGDFSQTFSIPADLAGESRIAIRLETETGFYAYNWFFNNDTVE